jgi:hypothetical protein
MFKTEGGKIIHPTTYRPVLEPRVKRKKAVLTIAIVLAFSSSIGGFAWMFRTRAFEVVGDPEFVASGAYHDPFGGPEQYSAIAGISIDNRTRYATGLTDWKVSLKFKDGKTVEGAIPAATDKDVPLSVGTFNGKQLNQLTLKPADYLPLKAAQPIPAGGGTWGWLPAIFKGYTRSDVRGKGGILTIEFSEIATGNKHVLTDSLDAPSAELPPGMFHIRKKPIQPQEN